MRAICSSEHHALLQLRQPTSIDTDIGVTLFDKGKPIVAANSSVTTLIDSVVAPPVEFAGKVVLTYGTFDLLHVGHLNLLERLRKLGDHLIVGVSTDEFNAGKGKRTVIPYADRARLVSALSCVDLVIPEERWEQKAEDITKYHVDVFGMGADWEGKFDELKGYCQVVSLPRTDGISSSQIKTVLSQLDKVHVDKLKNALELMSDIVSKMQ